MNFRATLKPLGYLLWVLAGSQLFPLLLALTEPQDQYLTIKGFVVSIAVVLAIGTGLWLAGRSAQGQLHRKEGLLIVAANWLLAGMLGSLPFVVSGAIPGMLDAVFESVSGFTTTGASILTDIEAMPRSILLWRSLTHWLGGMGIVVLFVAILPSLGIGGKHLYRIEATGPSVTGLHPRAVDTARMLWLIYAGFSLVEFLLLWLGGMGWFDAVCHTFGTMATGGFSTQNTSLAGYGTYFHVVVTIFMFLCGVNFSLYYQALRGKFLFWRDAEFRFYLLLLGGGSAVLLVCALVSGWAPFGVSLRDSLFVGTSIMTTTGYGTADYEQWLPLSQGMLLLMMFVGGSAGSTGGGIKVVRVLIALRAVFNSIVHSFRPQAVLPVRVGGEPVDREVESQVLGFVMAFVGWFILGALVMLACGHDSVTSWTASVAAVANIGPGLGLVGPTDNYAAIHPFAKGFLALLMVVGRLEVMAIASLFVPGFWRR